MSKQQIFIDTDCGVDDATAIMLALADQEAEVVGISTVAGNTSLDNVVKNVCGILNVTGHHTVPVFRGASRGLVEPRIHAEEVHGGNGLAGIDLPPGEVREDGRMAPQGLWDTARSHPGMTLVALGPLTNIAMAFNLYPDLCRYLGRIVVMGGGIQYGNVTPYAEFNFYADPEAVQVVLESSAPLTVVPWDLTLTNLTPEEEIHSLGMESAPVGPFFLKLQAHVMNFYEQMQGRRVTGHPDPLTMAYVLKPSLATRIEKGGVKMVLDRSPLRGMSVLFGEGNVEVVLGLEHSGFLNLLLSLKNLEYKEI
jgi:inosine-uridine nucleoside N-ribohydrolase